MGDQEFSEYFTTSIEVSMTNELENVIRYGTLTTLRNTKSTIRRGKNKNDKILKSFFKKNLEDLILSDFKQTLIVCVNLSSYWY